MKNIAQAFNLAINNVRSRFFHTFLSVLGIIIGVGALVSILSLIDGLEKYAKDQIEQTTSLNTVVVTAPETELVNDVKLNKTDVEKFDYSEVQSMLTAVDPLPRYFMRVVWNTEVEMDTTKVAAMIEAIDYYESDEEKIKGAEKDLAFGHLINAENNTQKQTVAVINESLADLLQPQNQGELLGKMIQIEDVGYKIQGIKKEDEAPPKIQIPASLVTKEKMADKRPIFIAQAADIDQLSSLQKQIQDWFAKNSNSDDIKVDINEFRIEQLEQGFLLFRLIMGIIVGISVIVGGVGIMNVMLISVKERTSEIGIRKAIGAKKKDILSQFLAESVFVSLLGSALGVLLGMGFTAVVVPIVNTIIEKTGGDEGFLKVAFTFNTIFIIAIIAVLIGVLFGTYPAIRASKLNPVDAIRRV